MSQRVVSDVSSTWHRLTQYKYYQNILLHTISTVVLTGVGFSIETIVSEESSHIHCVDPIKFYPLIGYKRIINQNMSVHQY